MLKKIKENDELKSVNVYAVIGFIKDHVEASFNDNLNVNINANVVNNDYGDDRPDRVIEFR